MAEPDLIQTLPDGTSVLTVVQDLHVSRHGGKPVIGPNGETLGCWRIAIGWARYRLDADGKVKLQNNGQPQVHSHGGGKVDVVDIWSAPLTQLAYSAVRELAYRHLRAGGAGVAEPIAAQISTEGLVDLSPVEGAPAAKQGLLAGIWRWLRRG